MKQKRAWIIIGLVVALAAGGVYLATRSADAPTAVNQLLADMPTARVIRTTLANSVESSGSVIPETTVSLSFGASGTVDQLKVAVGDRVKKGDVLAVLDTTDLQSKVTQAEQAYVLQQLTYSNTIEADPSQVSVAQAAYDSAQAAFNAAQQDYANLADKQAVQCAQLTSAEANLDRAQTAYDRVANDHQAKNYLVPGGKFYPLVQALSDAKEGYNLAVSNCNIARTNLNDSNLRSAQAQLQTARNNVDNLLSPRTEKQIQAKAQLEQARLSLEQAKHNLTKAALVAPFDGLVTAVNVQAGGTAGASAALTLADVRQLHVDVLVDETQIAMIQPGQAVELTLDAMPDVTLTGKVDRIDPSGTVSQGVVNYNVRVNLDPTDALVRLDMTANAAILGERHENVLAVPSTAIRSLSRSDGQGAFMGQGSFGGQGGFAQRGQGQTGQGGPSAQGGQVVTGTQRTQRLQGPFVLVIENGQPRPVPVTEGLTSGDLTEITGDLQEGDEVLAGELTLPNGASGAQPGMMIFGGPPPGGGPPPF
jgi:HlyD family secretion protein